MDVPPRDWLLPLLAVVTVRLSPRGVKVALARWVDGDYAQYRAFF